jgi:phosphatidate cytidylyltransferase
MLRTRLLMGSVLVVLAAGALVFDQPWYPFLFFLLLGLSLAACHEMVHLLDRLQRPPAWLCYAAVAGLIVANWVPHVAADLQSAGPWLWLLAVYTVVILLAFLVEMARFREPGGVLPRMALVLWIAAYLGLLPSFLAQLRWLDGDPNKGTIALVLAIFVPKVCDIGAYFTGRFLGKHPMAPVLSPKKTWEGAAGGLAAAALTAIALDRLTAVSLLRGDFTLEIGFGITMGIASMLGDLAESMVKRDCGRKDASQAVPGFGGVLDVVDAVIFPAPLAYVWFRTLAS